MARMARIFLKDVTCGVKHECHELSRILEKCVEFLEGDVNFCIIGERNTTSALFLANTFYNRIRLRFRILLVVCYYIRKLSKRQLKKKHKWKQTIITFLKSSL